MPQAENHRPQRGENIDIKGGRLGLDPKTGFTQERGTAWTRMSVAKPFFDPETGREVRAKTEWFDVTTFGKLAEEAADKLRKGDSVDIRGFRTKDQEWTDQTTGETRTRGNQVRAEEISIPLSRVESIAHSRAQQQSQGMAVE